MPRYRLIDEQGDDLGPFHAAAPTWAVGDKIHRGRGASLVVVNVTPAFDGDEVDGYLVVRIVDSPSP